MRDYWFECSRYVGDLTQLKRFGKKCIFIGGEIIKRKCSGHSLQYTLNTSFPLGFLSSQKHPKILIMLLYYFIVVFIFGDLPVSRCM